jgi:hypothetical protein
MTQRISGDTNRVLKVDKRGRVRSTPEQRAEVLAEFDRSGLSGTKFAALAGVNYQTFAAWLGKRRRVSNQPSGTALAGETRPVSAAGPMRWVEAVVGGGAKPALIVELRGGMRLEIGGAAQVPLAVQLLKALEAKEEWSC